MDDSRLPAENPDDLVKQVHELLRRVALIEQRLGIAIAAPPAAAASPAPPAAAAAFADTAAAIPVLGKAMLGLALAYLLRALTEYNVLPAHLGVALGVIYALIWLIAAARLPEAKRLPAAVEAVTSALILVALLYESRVRFQAIGSWPAATVLVVFTGFGLTISWRRNLSAIAWATILAGLSGAAILLVATHNLVPYVAALLLIAAMVEASACFEHWLTERWVAAIVADMAVLLLTLVVTRQGGVPEGYAPISIASAIAVQAGLLAVYLASTIVRTLWRGFTFTTFETVQCAFAFLIATFGTTRVAQENSSAIAAVAAFCLACGAACYVVSFAFLERRGATNRNFYTYSLFGLLLAVSGLRLLLTGLPLVMAFSVLALACVRISGRTGRMTLRWHGIVYLLLGVFASGLLQANARVLLRGIGHSSASSLSPVLWVAGAAVLLAYMLIFFRREPDDGDWDARFSSLLLAALAAWSAAGIAAQLLTVFCWHAPGSEQSREFCPALRTVAVVLLILSMASLGVRRRKAELVWLVYPLTLLAAYKLLVQDIRQGHTLAVAASLVLYGGSLLLLPRILLKPRPAG
jgi:hypothetical protein